MTHHVTHLGSRFRKLELGTQIKKKNFFLTIEFFSLFFAWLIFKSKTNAPYQNG